MSRETRKEISFFHPLAGRTLITLARRGDCDDVLFQLDDGPEMAVVHLTWSSRRERSGYPATQIFSDRSDFLSTRMEAGRIDFGED